MPLHSESVFSDAGHQSSVDWTSGFPGALERHPYGSTLQTLSGWKLQPARYAALPWLIFVLCVLRHFSRVQLFCDPMKCSPPDCSVHGILQENNTGEGCHSLLQGIFPTQGSNPSFCHLPHWWVGSFPLAPLGKFIFTSLWIVWWMSWSGVRGEGRCSLWVGDFSCCFRWGTLLSKERKDTFMAERGQ